MGQRDFAFLDALAKSLVSSLPIEAAVSFDKQTTRLTINLHSLPDPSDRRATLARDWSPTVQDYADLEQFVRDRVNDFIALMELAVPEPGRDDPGIPGDWDTAANGQVDEAEPLPEPGEPEESTNFANRS
jgi:hypothetical protein